MDGLAILLCSNMPRGCGKCKCNNGREAEVFLHTGKHRRLSTLYTSLLGHGVRSKVLLLILESKTDRSDFV